MADAQAERKEFYRSPQLEGASKFGSEFRNLACDDVKTLGYRFRLAQEDPVAVALKDRRLPEIPERVELSNGLRNFVPVCFLELGMLHAKAVCKIEAKGTNYKGEAGQVWTGTGFLVGPNLLLTNHHVLNSLEVAKEAVCVFNFQLDVRFSPLETVGVRLDPARLFLTSPLDGGLDFTFVWIEGAAHEQFGFIPMHRSAFTVHPGDFANVVQHPQGRRKETVVQDNQIIQDTGIVLHYSSDTEEGSSGAPVFNNRWELIALHRASRGNEQALRPDKDLPPPHFLNEGVKISAIAADLERRAQAGEPQAVTALSAFSGVDSLMGFFGGLGRAAGPELANDRDRLVELYSSEAEDVDVAFWHVAWLNERFAEKIERVATAIADLNVDIWTLFDCVPDASAALAEALRRDFKLAYTHVASADGTRTKDRTIAVLWNTRTVEGRIDPWPDDLDRWFGVRSAQFPDLELEAVRGPLFEAAPRLLTFAAKQRPEAAVPFQFRLVPVNLGVTSDGSLRRRRALSILATALEHVSQTSAMDCLLGGQFDASVASEELQHRLAGRMASLSAGSAADGAIAYVKGRRSPLRRMFLSPNLCDTFGARDFFVRAAGSELPDHVRQLSLQQPVVARLSLLTTVEEAADLPETLEASLDVRPTPVHLA